MYKFVPIFMSCFVVYSGAENIYPTKNAPYKPPARLEEELSPQPFAYQYGVQDEYTGTNFDKTEEQDAYGNLQGSYRVNLPDGRIQIVSYRVDDESGYVAEVKYEGEAQYPPEPNEGYGYSKPEYRQSQPVA